MTRALYVGLMSGTSADGVDACLATFGRHRVRALGHVHVPFDARLRDEVLAVARGSTLERASTLDVTLADVYTRAVTRLLHATGTERDAVRAIGCHGQTVLHRPEGPTPTSLQLGDPHRLAVHTGIDVVADFRRADVAAGGQGAPLAPAFHADILRDARETRAVANIGGMANITWLPPGRGPILGFDTGPGNVLLDGWCERHRGRPYDEEGAWAATGSVDEGLLRALRGDPYFARRPPKSTGREHFDLAWLDAVLADRANASAPADVQATLAALTAHTIADAVQARDRKVDRLLVCGGGAHNADLRSRLRACLPGIAVESTADHGIEPEWVEPLAFAWLAHRRVRGLPGNRPEVTGADRALVLGALVRAPR